MELFTFKAADEYFGIDARYIYRVIEDVKITRAPLTPPLHLGLIYYRGELFDVIDIAGLLTNGKSKFDANIRIMLLKWSDKKLAMVPGKIIGLLWIEDGKDTDTVNVEGKYTVRRVTPEQIWAKLLALTYGPSEIPKDIQPGV